MIEAFVHINIAQALFMAIITLAKRSLKVFDKILAVWLFTISFLFTWNLVRLQIPSDIINNWIFRAVIVLSFPSFLFLYIKYITTGKDKFQARDLWHLTVFALMLLAIIILGIIKPDIIDTYNFIHALNVFPIIFGFVFLFTFIVYGYHTFKLLRGFTERRDEYYSYKNGELSTKSLGKLVYFFYSYFIVLIVIGLMLNLLKLTTDLSLFFTLCFTIYIYIVSYWGFKQGQLQEIPLLEKEPGTSYKKSGLKEKDARKFERSIILLMENEKPWLKPEITVSDISTQLSIPQHYITQVLNEGLKKNFYTLINEYRTNEVIRLFQEAKYIKWDLTSIAFEAGFNSKSSFNSFFKKHTGKTPSEYRKEIIVLKR